MFGKIMGILGVTFAGCIAANMATNAGCKIYKKIKQAKTKKKCKSTKTQKQ